MCADEADDHDTHVVIDKDDQAVSIVPDLETCPVIPDHFGGWKIIQYVLFLSPYCSFGNVHPGSDAFPGIGMLFTKSLSFLKLIMRMTIELEFTLLFPQ